MTAANTTQKAVVYRALLVCNSVYDGDTQSLQRLVGPSADGPLLRHVLTDAQTGMFGDQDVTVLFDATSTQILDTASVFFRECSYEDTLLFYFSGHGRSKNEKLYLCGRNTVGARLAGTAVSNESLTEMITDSSARAKVIILDCCEAGAWKGTFPPGVEFGRGSFLLAAATSKQSAEDAERAGHPSPFTQVVVDGLGSGATSSGGSGHISLDDLYRFLESRAHGRVRPYRRFDGVGDIPIARRVAADAAATPRSAADSDVGHLVGRLGTDRRAEPVERRPFLDETTPDTAISTVRVTEFRANLKQGIAVDLPAQLTPTEFLRRAHLYREDKLTRAGALLFGEDPTAVVATAIVQCTQVHGVSKDAVMDARPPLTGSVPEQIVQARDFVANLARRGDSPTEDDAQAQPYYEYPMIAVREVIANALVHRDYEHSETCVHVRVYSDRIEIVNPGPWQGADLQPGEKRPLGALAAESRRRNFRLANVLTWIKVVEGEGSGIPRALSDCRRVGAPEPTVTHTNGLVTVTIYPREAETTLIGVGPRNVEVRERIHVDDRLDVRAVSLSAGHSPLFYLSYAREQKLRRPVNPSDEANQDVVKFFVDLSIHVNELVPLPPGQDPGFMDIQMDGGERWEDQILRAAGSCQVFIALLSPNYLHGSRWCAMEWDIFAKRAVSPAEADGFLPVLWAPPTPLATVPPALAKVSRFTPSDVDSETLAIYEANGLLGLRRLGLNNAYETIVWKIALHIQQMADTRWVEPRIPTDISGLRRSFEVEA